MSALAIGGIVFVCFFGGALLGMWIRTALPAHHLTTEARDTVRLGIGLLVTMTALVLSLLVASARSSYDLQGKELAQVSADVILLDRIMALYGPETKAARDLLRRAVVRVLAGTSAENESAPGLPQPTATGAEALYDTIQALSPGNEAQRSLRAEALRIGLDIARTRWLLVEQRTSSIPVPFLVMLIVWLAVIFISFGLFAPPNATVVATLLVCALSVSGAIFLILELDQPFEGFMQVSRAPLRRALAYLGQ